MVVFEIKSGNLFQNGIKIIPEFGNLLQIQFIRRYEEKMKDFLRGIPVEPSFEYEVKAHANFNCICGKPLQVSVDSNKKEVIHKFDEVIITCQHCEKSYNIEVFNSSELLITFSNKKIK